VVVMVMVMVMTDDVVQSVWNVEEKLLPIIIGAAGTLSRSFQKHLNYISGISLSAKDGSSGNHTS
jgi:hypothetical protein